MNIYNGLLRDEDIEVSSVKEFADLSEQELDRIEVLVQNLLSKSQSWMLVLLHLKRKYKM